MIIWGSGNGRADLGIVEHRHCQTCEKERPFRLLLQYKYAHVYYLRWVVSKAYHLGCDICHRGFELKAKDVEPTLKVNSIPFATRYGWIVLAVAGLAFIVAMSRR